MKDRARRARRLGRGALITAVAVAGTSLGLAASAPAAEAPSRSAPSAPSAHAAQGAEAGVMANPTLREVAGDRFIGTAINNGRLNDSTYRNIASTEFDSVTAENVMKWESIQPSQGQFNYGEGDRLVDFAQQNDQLVYGHTLVWHSQLPGWVENHNGDSLRQVMNDHITNVVGHYRGDIQRWDVVNEAFDGDGSFRDSHFYRQLGEDYIAEAFRTADAADPNAKLFINDYSIDGINAKSDGMYRLVQSLLQQGVPIDGVGFQSHHILGQIPGNMQQNLQRFADLGLEVVITELDIRMDVPATESKLQQQARDTTAVAEACLNVAACSGITVWGFGDRDSWVPDVFEGQGAANLYDDNYQPKPGYYAMRDALQAASGEGGGDDGGGDDGGGDDGTTGCSATYEVNRWGSGSTVNVTLQTESALNGWTVEFDLPQGETVTNGWNADVSQSGTRVSATNAPHNGDVAAGGSLSFGFQTSGGAEYSAPPLTLDGATCS